MRLTWKIVMMFGLTVAVLIPLGLIRGTVAERQRYRAEAVEEVARSTAGAQTLAGPILVVPYSDRVSRLRPDENGVQRRVDVVESGAWVFFPRIMTARGRMQSLPRRLGLHEVRVYEFHADVRAAFHVTLPRDDDPFSPRTIGQARLGFGLRDVRGLVGVPSLRVDGTSLPLRQGLGPAGGRGLHALLPRLAPGQPIELDVEFKAAVQGTETLSIVPLAGRNSITVASPWPHPKFHGEFLPRARDVRLDGFDAHWEVSSLATNAQAQMRDALRRPGSTESQADAVSVSLVDPVNAYSKVDRATKYGVLFVLLTFVAFYMFELLKQLRIHPIQYGLVGLALSIFFLLLLALSEHVQFVGAYVTAAVACVGLIAYYLGHVLGSHLRATGFSAMLGTLYAALYGLLVSEDNALVLGAGLLFLVLAAVMVLTRKVDWYQAAARS